MEPSLRSPTSTTLPTIDVGAIASAVATKTPNADIPAQLLFLPGQYLLVTREDGATTYKFLSPEAVTSAFRQEPIDSGWLPPHTLRWGHNLRGSWVVQFYPPARYQIILKDFNSQTTTVNVPMPGLVFFGCGSCYWLWVVGSKQFDPHCRPYRAPLPNVMSDGKICFGDQAPPKSSLQGIVRAWQQFWNSAFSDHAVDGKSHSHSQDVRSLLKQLHDRKSKRYPIRDLIQFTDRTISNVIEQLI